MTACAFGFTDGFIFALGALAAVSAAAAALLVALRVFLWWVKA